eukprot:TRINITY_DN24003_c0_g3_i1.p1 TRINITY_DN24003_c0_g3~~TRINITY_DN24003_c0_g3_i1.p1  ORF type:complete len:205 (-),score=33.82 TRINITY_DN24003_c0_g3_i1:648-1211(-)
MSAGSNCPNTATVGEQYVEHRRLNVNPCRQWCKPKETNTRAGRDSVERQKVSQDFARGKYCEVRKHAHLGTATVIFESEEFKAAMLKFMDIRDPFDRARWKVGPHQVTVQDHLCKKARKGIFVHWGRKVEQIAPCSAATVARHVDIVAREVKVALETGLQPPRADQVPFPLFESEQLKGSKAAGVLD